ncbi:MULTISPECIES: hypothetical protein [unclassified Aurantimonas]|uniref:hypothetical protein n=1 Tax=unclassified Aurantimonas TaxID=2638230 RepID=UPI002E16E742|nr:hypothetical protein [Aurantimonas sp. A3-2-R12]
MSAKRVNPMLFMLSCLLAGSAFILPALTPQPAWSEEGGDGGDSGGSDSDSGDSGSDSDSGDSDSDSGNDSDSDSNDDSDDNSASHSDASDDDDDDDHAGKVATERAAFLSASPGQTQASRIAAARSALRSLETAVKSEGMTSVSASEERQGLKSGWQ